MVQFSGWFVRWLIFNSVEQIEDQGVVYPYIEFQLGYYDLSSFQDSKLLKIVIKFWEIDFYIIDLYCIIHL